MRNLHISWLQVPLWTLLVVACETTPLGTRECGGQCYTGPQSTVNIGECRTGTWACVGANTPVCGNEVTPRVESCADLLDLDCSGKVGDGIPQLGVECDSGLFGDCAVGHSQCLGESLVCVPDIMPREESCVGMTDTNCNGIINEIPFEFCYEGDWAELLGSNSACRAGYRLCFPGATECIGEVRPQPEICGNNIDEDCNGLLDLGGPDQLLGIDIVVILDRSGSMADELASAVDAIQLFALGPNTQHLRLGLVTIGEERLPTTFRRFDLVSTATAAMLLEAYRLPTAGGEEYIYDALFDIASGRLPFTWRAHTQKAVIFIGDEHGQSMRNITAEQAHNALAAEEIIFYGFVDTMNVAYYSALITDSGALHEITLSSLQLMLPEVLKPKCGP